MLGVIEIPKINVSLPIFDQTTEIFLQKERHYWKKVLIRLAGKTPMPFFLGIVDSQKQNYLQICLLKKETSFHPDQWKDIGVSSRKIQVVLPDEVDSLGIQKAEIS